MQTNECKGCTRRMAKRFTKVVYKGDLHRVAGTQLARNAAGVYYSRLQLPTCSATAPHAATIARQTARLPSSRTRMRALHLASLCLRTRARETIKTNRPPPQQRAHAHRCSTHIHRHRLIAISLRHIGVHAAEPRLLLQPDLLVQRQPVDDAPAVALVALHPEDGFGHFLRLGDGGGALWRLWCKEISINKLHSGKSSVKAG